MESGNSKIYRADQLRGCRTQKDPMFQFKSEMVNLICQPDWAKGLFDNWWKVFLDVSVSISGRD